MKKAAFPIFAILAVCALIIIFSYDSGWLPLQVQQVSSHDVEVATSQQDDVLQSEDVALPTATQATQSSMLAVADSYADTFDGHVQQLADPALDAVCDYYNAVGVQCAVIEDGFVTGSYVYGYADRKNDRAVTQQTKYRVASLSKLVTNMVFMKLADNGIVNLDADIGDYYGFEVRNPSYPDVSITPRQLMTHTASVIDGEAFEYSLSRYSSEPIRSILQSRSVYSSAKPGSLHSYSNFSSALVGSVCELASGLCFEDLAQSLWLEPMDIDGGYVASSVENAEDIGLLYGGSSTLESQLLSQFDPTLGQTIHLVQGNLTVSATDYAKLLCVLLNNGKNADGTQMLSSQAVSEILSVQYSAGEYGVGLGCFIYNDTAVSGRTLYCHTGSAYGMYACYAIDPVTKDGVVVLTSGADYAVDSRTEIYKICLELIRTLLPA